MSASKRILVVNDTKEILELFRDFLETELGHKVLLMSFAPMSWTASRTRSRT